ncbi:prepilin [Thermus scotoductus]|uniref:Prepilin n=1 Tax=Thermus scotoductus TaxID=37636 RepID=A0A430R2W9_THESC|nr:prepilin-type N-terminal cleavage/methylation domain-containing protein [Thermus scotoductus]RTH01731.1 prepilin [Thermus scotoductus]
MRPRGLTLVEILVAIALLTGIMAVALRYFVLQAEHTRRIQARNEVQERVRMVMEIVSQDLLLAGNQYFVSSESEKINLAPPYLSATDGGSKDSFTVKYVTSLRQKDSACRVVSYSFSGNTLQRRDVTCDKENDSSIGAQPLAGEILVLNITYVCSSFEEITTNGTKVVRPVTAASGAPPCPTGSYPRSARIQVVGRSLSKVPGSTFPDPNLASDCKDYVCFALEQEVLLPNLKDQ